MAFRSDISALILGTLQAEPLHGYQIVRRIREAGEPESFPKGRSTRICTGWRKTASWRRSGRPTRAGRREGFMRPPRRA